MGKDVDSSVLKARELFVASGKTLDEVGVAMGCDTATARKSVWQLLNKVSDPKISTLRKFAAALGVPMSAFFPDEKKSPSK
jgi:transcriptional regulator with XRE-family HTH domain